MIYNSQTERQDMFFKGKIAQLDEFIGLPEVIKERLNSRKKSEA